MIINVKSFKWINLRIWWSLVNEYYKVMDIFTFLNGKTPKTVKLKTFPNLSLSSYLHKFLFLIYIKMTLLIKDQM